MSITFLDENNIKQGLGDDERSVISQKAMTAILSEFTTNEKARLSSTGDQTDRTSEIMSMLTNYGVCYLDSGEFYVTQIDMPESSSIIGCGEGSVLVQIARTDEVGGRTVINLGNHCLVSNVNILGQLRTRPAEIEIDNPDYAIKLDTEGDIAQTCKIENTTIRGFSGAGIYVYDTGYGPLRSVLVSNVEIKNCGAGIYTGYHGEYGCYSNVTCVDNYIGCYNNGGNNKFVGCGFDRNYYGLYMTSGNTNTPNNGHGTCTGCTFNHNVYSAIYAHTVVHGFIIDSCQMFHNGSTEYPSIHLLNSNGIVISDSEVSGNIKYPVIVKVEAVEGKYQNNTAILTSCLFHYLPQVYVGDRCTLQIDGCYMLDGTSITRESLKTVHGNIIALQNFESNKYEFTCSNSTLEDLSTETITMCGKNLLKNIALDKTSQGITFTKSNFGVSVVGTATENSFYSPNTNFYLPAGNYHLSGCPKGGSSTKYALRVQKTENGVATLLGSDYGNGLDFVVPEDVTLNVFIVIFSGQTVNLNFTPMIELASVATGEFEAYKELQCNVDATGKIVASEYFNPTSVFYGTSADTTITMTYLQTADEIGATNLIATKASNAVEGHISGEIISISDISPIQHNISTHLYTKNLIIPNETTFIYPNGYTATLNDDGSVTVSGSANTTESINLSIALRKRDGTYNSIPLEAGQKYRMHFYKDGEISVRGRLKITNSSGTNFFESVTAWNQTDNLLSEDRNITNIYVDSSDQAIGDTSLCGTYKVIVEKDLSAVSVLEYGKNLVPYPFNETTKTVNGITFVDNRDGTVTATGTATADTGMYLFSTSYNPIKLSKGMYVLSGCPTGGSTSTYSISVGTSTSTVAMDYGNNPVFTISEELSNTGVGVSLKIAAGATVNGLVFKPQIELGAVATEFEKYLTPKVHTSSEFGVIEDIPSRYPAMTLKTNVSGVIVDVEYNKDVNAEFEQLNHKPLITFIDDDCQDEQLTNWEEINKLTGVKPTIAVITNNPLDAPNDASRYTTWSNIQRLTNCGFEFISHTDTHLNLTECDSAALESELSTSLSKLQEHGINPKFLVYPYNAYNDTVIDCVRKYYKGAVTCEYQTNIAPINDFAIKRQSFTSTKQFNKTFDDGTTRTVYQFRTDDELRQMINEAAAKNGWIIFMTHLRNYDVYYYDNDIKTKLVNLIEYAKAKGLQPVSLNEGYEFMKDRREQISSSSVSYSRFIDEKEVDAKIKTVETQLNSDINEALKQAKESGEFKGDSYVLTEDDKQEIAGKSRGNTYISLPNSVNVKVGNEFKVYYRNIISRDDIVLWVGYNNNLTTRYYDDYLSIIANTTGTHSLPWKVFDKGSNLIDSGEFNIIATAKVPTNTTIALVIGDSTVNADTMTDKTKALYTADGANLNLLGTRGNGHEGRGGWTAKMYCTEASSGGVDNPFYNNGFDFAYYMTNQNYSGVQAVAIQLGINDIFAFKDYDWALYNSSEVLGYINQMVTSILVYDSNIKVIINLPTTPNSNGTSFTESYGTTQLYWTYNRNIIRFAEDLKDYFANNASVTISASNCILDTKTQIRDGIHPTEEGYNALGQRLYEVLISIVEGGVVVVPLLDISKRARVVHTGNTIAATEVHELDATKCYDTTFNGIRSDTTSNAITSYTPTSSSSFILNQNACGGQGIEFPVPSLEVGKTYTINYTVNATARLYLVKYTSDGVYSSNEALSTKAGTFTQTITPESGYIYSLCFCSFTANTDCIFSGISLTEN